MKTGLLPMTLAAFAAGGSQCFAAPVAKATITVTGSAAKLCTLGTPRVLVTGSNNLGTVSGATVNITELSDYDTLSTKATNFDVTFPAMCNFDHQLEISSDRGGLWRDGASPPVSGFAQAVPYRADFSWADVTGTLSATAASESEVDVPVDVNEPAFGNVVLHFHIDQGATNVGSGAPLEAGTYEDIVRVTLGAQ